MQQVVAALIWKDDRFFICQRPPQKARGLLWEFVGGKVEPGETPPQALKREFKEELNAEITVGSLFARVIHEYPDITIELLLYNATLENRYSLLEHVDARWITPAEIDRYAFCPADEEILNLLKHR